MKLLIKTLFIFSSWAMASEPHNDDSHSDMMHHSHEGHLHNELVDGEKLEVNPDRFDKFVLNLTNTQVAVISVKGMVCDFCARGIEKTFQKDKLVKKIDVDLAQGKVLLAYDKDIQIVFEDIQNKILANGINAIKMQILVI
ncbi:MAG: heavy metal-associated domain-containing protein [Proteobacteria bacterium]|nr:heavy metal-associated domain-containing protein [Pseudomonadota bacterium]MDA0976847.1 heavy metal-associated domain-containing protein [Pseudomonadota bacterium]MDA1037041.1 heavy metal-associated domain-containing protein [Pseudomonadota bacterium]